MKLNLIQVISLLVLFAFYLLEYSSAVPVKNTSENLETTSGVVHLRRRRSHLSNETSDAIVSWYETSVCMMYSLCSNLLLLETVAS